MKNCFIPLHILMKKRDVSFTEISELNSKKGKTSPTQHLPKDRNQHNIEWHMEESKEILDIQFTSNNAELIMMKNISDYNKEINNIKKMSSITLILKKAESSKIQLHINSPSRKQPKFSVKIRQMELIILKKIYIYIILTDQQD